MDAARALRLALDAQVPRITRLDALGDFLDGLPAVIAEPQAVDNLAREVLAAAAWNKPAAHATHPADVWRPAVAE